jgi:regulator of protease activity HflC (stomatin/prohibitin superfamily)
MTAVLVVLVVLLVLALSMAGASVRVLREYERGVVFRFGRLVAQKGPASCCSHTIPPQDVITRDNVPARVDAVAYFRVVDADASIIDVETTCRHHRRADRTVGYQGRHRRNQGRGDPAGHAARDGLPGGGRA